MLKKIVLTSILAVFLSLGFSSFALANEGGESVTGSILDQYGFPVEAEMVKEASADVDTPVEESNEILVKCAPEQHNIRSYNIDYCWDQYGS